MNQFDEILRDWGPTLVRLAGLLIVALVAPLVALACVEADLSAHAAGRGCWPCRRS